VRAEGEPESVPDLGARQEHGRAEVEVTRREEFLLELRIDVADETEAEARSEERHDPQRILGLGGTRALSPRVSAVARGLAHELRVDLRVDASGAHEREGENDRDHEGLAHGGGTVNGGARMGQGGLHPSREVGPLWYERRVSRFWAGFG